MTNLFGTELAIVRPTDAKVAVLAAHPEQATPSQADLDQRAEQLRVAYADLKAGVRTTFMKAVEVGKLLIDAKRRMPHGSFLPWLEREVGIKPRAAQQYMELAKVIPMLPPANAKRIAQLGIAGALAEIRRNRRLARSLTSSVAPRAGTGGMVIQGEAVEITVTERLPLHGLPDEVATVIKIGRRSRDLEVKRQAWRLAICLLSQGSGESQKQDSHQGDDEMETMLQDAISRWRSNTRQNDRNDATPHEQR